jgi:putative DNA methylase
MTAGSKRKLIEVALPLEIINREAAREGFIYRGNPSAVHKWWAQRPLAACRAVLFASLVDDPSSDPERFPTEELQDRERQELFRLIADMVTWENMSDPVVFGRVRSAITDSVGELPALVDPFCGGGSIPLEAQRLGLAAHASDLNPVAVLITKALIEIPPRFAGRPPVHPDAHQDFGASGSWSGASGLSDDVRRYAGWIRDEAERRIGHLYPRIGLPKEHGGGDASVIAWLWARTVTCPNPACGGRMPLMRSFVLSSKKGKEVWVDPVVDRAAKTVRFEVRRGAGSPGTSPKVGRGANFRCLICGQVAPDEHVKAEGRAKRMDAQLMSIVAQAPSGRVYLSPSEEHDRVARSAQPSGAPEEELADDPRNIWTVNYGLTRVSDLFSARQLVALTTFSDLVSDARAQVHTDALATGMQDDSLSLEAGGSGALAYADSVATYLAFAVDKTAEYGCTLVPWYSKEDRPKGLFARQAIPMLWDYTELNPLGSIGGTLVASARVVAGSLLGVPAQGTATVLQADATKIEGPLSTLVSTDPPYYDNIAYANLSDFFYVWLRRSLADVFPDLFGTLLTPKIPELVASPYRFGGDKSAAEQHFEVGLGESLSKIRSFTDPSLPITIWYAFKQTETENRQAISTVASTGWETMLEGLLKAGFAVVGTWPIRTERGSRSISLGTNALASSIVLVCRPRSETAPLATLREFAAALAKELPDALMKLQAANIAPVDLEQSAIGPGMAVFSRYAGVLEASGEHLPVRRALQLINAELDRYFASENGQLDSDTRWCLTWFQKNGFSEAEYGSAETLANARNVSVAGLVRAGILESRAGKVRVLRPIELDASWDPLTDERLSIWECTHQLVRALHDARGGIEYAARLAAKMGEGRAQESKDLAYGLFNICVRHDWLSEAVEYNDLVSDWSTITERAQEIRASGRQDTLGL